MDDRPGHMLFDVEVVAERGPPTWRRRWLIAAPDPSSACSAALLLAARRGMAGRVRSFRLRDYYIVHACGLPAPAADTVVMLDIDGVTIRPFTPHRRR